MLQKLKEFLTGHKNDDISPSEAEKIQKLSYASNHEEIKKKFSPTYLSVLPGLDSEEKQLFEATVYYLVQIAINKPKYHQEIVNKLKEKSADKKLNPVFKECIKQQLRNIS